MGIRMRSVLVMGVLGFLAIAVIGFASYRLSVNNALNEAQIKSDIVLNYAMATRLYMQRVQRPLALALVEEDRFYPELMSGFVSARGTFEIFEELYPGYIFKQATLDPLNPYNLADRDEVRIIEHFQDNPELTSTQGQLAKNGTDLYYFAQPIRVDREGCLSCHGDPADAPKDQVEIYGDQNGYHWNMNETVAAFVVYIPTAEAIAAAKTLSITLVLIGATGIAIMLFIIGWFLNRDVVNPIVRLAERTESFSFGKNLDEPIDRNAVGEVGTLAQAIERLRISLKKLLQRSR
ncbi:Tll0287-like domain-containing protein [Desulfurivibrio dismutans]|uniref:Tll0287-like domain-containing protein n=1 Tax=Desulfurivibrio dismutans TaxID=1398908 RepID=UPI0023D9E4BA|nr:methyl-accepting chemotaxis protein [Desulfurivibrio alkaliphilus]MDF1615311.1 methyl-accepting chemotaxis protein [Desulfurivibrio alkaliphilus]